METDEGYQFQYLPEYLNNHPVPASLTLPLQSGPYQSQTLFPFSMDSFPKAGCWISQ
nr:HipA N-terminal domain-containing protein [Faecalibaculum rodentium]